MKAERSVSRYLEYLAPYLAVVLFWNLLSNAWLAILAYHLQIIFWSRSRVTSFRPRFFKGDLVAAFPAALAGVAVYVLLPVASRVDLGSWLAAHHLSRGSFLLLIPYFGLVHPILEQLHWEPLRRRTILAHPLFAGYHLMVLGSLLTGPWLIVSFAVLMGVSYLWGEISRRRRSLSVAILMHVLADLGIVIAAWLQI